MTEDEQNNQSDDDGTDQLRSFAVLAFIAVLVALLLWLVNSFQGNNKTLECIEAGHHGCVPLDTSATGR